MKPLINHFILLAECKENQTEEPMVGLADLVEGAAHSYLGDTETAIKCYRNCVKRRCPSKDECDQHVSAFALYELGSSLCNNNVSIFNIQGAIKLVTGNLERKKYAQDVLI